MDWLSCKYLSDAHLQKKAAVLLAAENLIWKCFRIKFLLQGFQRKEGNSQSHIFLFLPANLGDCLYNLLCDKFQCAAIP